MTPSTVLILGANGRFGRAAVLAFAAAGWQVHAQLRRAPVAPLPPGARALTVSLTDTAGLVAAAAGATVVVHAINPIYTRWDEEALPALHQGLDVARRLGALFMLPGNVYNFGENMPPLLRPDTPQTPSTSKGRQRCAMEAAMQSSAAQGQRSVVICAGDFFGAGTGSWFDQAIVKNLAGGKLVYPGPKNLAHAWAYLPDLAQAFVAVASQPPTPGFQRLHFAGHTLTGAELLDAVDSAAHSLGLRPARGFRIGGMPWGLVRTVGLVYPLWRELARMSYLWRVPHALDGSALQAAAGPMHSTALDVAVLQTLLDLGFKPQARQGDPAAAALSSRA